MDLAREWGWPDWRRLMRVMGVKGIVEWMAHNRIHPSGFEIDDLRHMQQAVWHGKKPKAYVYRTKRKGPMTSDETAAANRQVERDMESGPVPGGVQVRR